jgi:hypothetical protein
MNAMNWGATSYPTTSRRFAMEQLDPLDLMNPGKVL